VRFRSENNYFDIIDYTRPVNKNYIILESLNQVKDNNNYKSIQVISLDENEKIIMVKLFTFLQNYFPGKRP
jgi:hypothetical protein